MTIGPSHTVKNGKRYRYYISRPLTTETKHHVPAGRRIPAGDIEHLVLHRVRAALSDASTVLEAIKSHSEDAPQQKQLLETARAVSNGWDQRMASQVRALLSALIARIDVLPKRVDIHLVRSRVAEVLLNDPHKVPPASACKDKTNRLILPVAAELRRAGKGMKMIIEARDANGQKTKPDLSLVKLIIKAHSLNDKLVNSDGASLAAIAKREGVTGSYLTRVVRLSFLSPDITRAILDGRHPPDLTAAKLARSSKLPLDWDQQKAALGFV